MNTDPTPQHLTSQAIQDLTAVLRDITAMTPLLQELTSLLQNQEQKQLQDHFYKMTRPGVPWMPPKPRRVYWEAEPVEHRERD